MCVDATQTTKTIDGHTDTFEVGKLNPAMVAHHHVFNMPTAIYQRADLSARLMRKFGELPRKFRRHNLVRGNAPGVKFFNATQLIGLEPSGVSD